MPTISPPALSIRKQQTGKIRGDEPLEIKKQHLKKATNEFESYFLLYMLKAMRKTIPKSDLMEGGFGKDIYTGMFDEELARKMAESSSDSIGDMLYRSLEKHLEDANPTQKDNSDTSKATSLSKIHRLPINRSKFHTRKLSFPKKTASPTEKPSEGRTHSSEQAKSVSSRLKPYQHIIEEASKVYRVDAQLISSVIMAESGGQADAVSPKGAKGLMQLMDSTANEMGVSDSLNPRQNIFGGTKYLRRMLDTFDGDIEKALAAYNAGPRTVSQYNGVPPYSETRQYIDKIMGALPHLKKS